MDKQILNDWTKNEFGRFLCTKNKPMPIEFRKGSRWKHEDAILMDYDGEYIEYKCHSCGHVWKIEMPD